MPEDSVAQLLRNLFPQDMARVARWMAGKAVGLVLSGGGSRGLAHLGVLHALDDAGVPVDVIGGTSQVCLPIHFRMAGVDLLKMVKNPKLSRT